MNAQRFISNYSTTLAAAVASGDLTMTLASGMAAAIGAALVDAGDFVILTLTQPGGPASETSWESVFINAAPVGDVVTVIRAWEGAAAAWPVSSVVQARFGATSASNLKVHPFSVLKLYKKGSRVKYAGGEYVLTADHPAGNWIGSDATFIRQLNGKFNTIGVYKPFGMQSTWTPGAIATVDTTTISFTGGVKFQMDAVGYRVKIQLYNKEANPRRGVAFSVSCTEVEAINTMANAIDPIVGAVSYNVLASSANPYGWNPILWGGAVRSRVQAPANTVPPGQGYFTIQDPIWSDWANIRPVPNTNGGFPLLILRTNALSKAGDSTSIISGISLIGQYNKYVGSHQIGRLMYAPTGYVGDAVADPTVAKTTDTTALYDPTDSTKGRWIDMAIAVDHCVPTRVFATPGDSITEAYNWIETSIRTISTQAAPCTIMNFGISTNRVEQYMQLIRNILRGEHYITDVIVPSFSPNEPTPQDQYQMLAYRARLMELSDMCKAQGIRVYVWTNYSRWISRYSTSFAVYGSILDLNAWVRTEATAGRWNLIEIETGWDNASMIDATLVHPNTVGQAFMISRTIPALQGE